VVVSHIGEFDLDAAIADVKKFYTGHEDAYHAVIGIDER
jgi:hypothetical protein